MMEFIVIGGFFVGYFCVAATAYYIALMIDFMLNGGWL